MTLVGLAFALVALVWVVLEHLHGLRSLFAPRGEVIAQAVQNHIKAALFELPKPVDHSAELAALTKQVESLKSAVGMKQLR